jgi:hypothetical protein
MPASHLHNNKVSKHAKEIFQEYNLKRAWKQADTHTSDISRSAYEECNKHEQRYIRLNDRYRKAKGVQQKLKSKVVQLEKANEALTEV